VAIVFRVYGQKLDEDIVFVISDSGAITKFPGFSEFDVANVLRAGGVGVRLDISCPISLVKRKYAINPYIK
jgi:hypothetical protein